MKPYPQVAEYAKAVLSPANYAKLKTLKPCSMSSTRGFATGESAVVFKMKDLNTNKFYALKCFTKDLPVRKVLYENITKYLKKSQNPYFVQFVYLEKEIRVKNAAYPVVFMSWIEGKTLSEYVVELCKENDTAKLMNLANTFDEMAVWLIGQGIAHGDLKPENIIVTPDNTLKLVDYDAMFLPAFRGKLAHEIGALEYQHPKRRKEQFNPNIDDFSILVISLSLHALAISPEIYKDIPDSDAILFNAIDFKRLSQFDHSNFFKKHAKTPVLYSRFCLLTHSVLQPSIELSTLKDILVENPAREAVEESPVPLSADDYDFKFNESTKMWEDKFGVRYSEDRTILKKAPWRRKAVIVPSCVSVIGEQAFSKCEALVSLELPNTVLDIELCAFAYCTSLPLLEIPDSVLTIGDKAFQHCRSIKKVVLPKSLENIGYDCFENCKELEIINIPETVTEIKDGAFKNCLALKTIVIPASVERIGSFAFRDCTALTTITFKGEGLRLGDAVFLNCKSLSASVKQDLEKRFGASCIRGSMNFKI